MYRHSYRGLAGALEAFGQARSVGERADAELGRCWPGMTGWFAMGIFGRGTCWLGRKGGVGPCSRSWTGRWCGAGVGRRMSGSLPPRRGCSIGFGGRGLLRAFLAGYAAVTGPLERAFVRRVAVHWGVHVAYWPTMVEWGTRAETAELVKVGLKVIELAMDEDWEGLAESELFRGSGDVWKGFEGVVRK